MVAAWGEVMTLSDFHVPACLMASSSPLSTPLACDQEDVLLENWSKVLEAIVICKSTWVEYQLLQVIKMLGNGCAITMRAKYITSWVCSLVIAYSLSREDAERKQI